jgi:MFS family permease
MQSLPRRTFWLFFAIAIPVGAYNGFVSFALGSLARSSGLSVGESARIIGLCSLPFSLGNLLGPVVDFGFTKRVWLLLTSLLGAILLGMSLAIPLSRQGALFAACAVTAGFLLIVTQAAGGALVAAATPAPQKGRAAAWTFAGIIFGAIIGSAGILLLLSELPVRLSVPILVPSFFLPALAVLAMRERPRDDEPAGRQRFLRIGNELKAMFTDHYALTGLLIFLSPVPSQAASNLFTAIAPDYRTGERAVALITGVGGNLISLVGVAAAGWICDRLDRRYAYMLGGLYLGTCSALLIVLPPTPVSYVVGTSLYMIGAGYVFAAAFALAFDLVGDGGITGGTRIGFYMGALSLAVLYCTVTEGWIYDHAGRRAMFGLDTTFNLAGVLVMTLVLRSLGKRTERKLAASPAGG